MLMLYLISPLVFAAEPLDDGAKRKQWTTAFLVQCCAVFGTVVAMRTLMVFIPIIISSDLVFFKHDEPLSSWGSFGYSLLDLVAKIIMIYGGFEVVKKANGIITGILADSAGWQSISAGDMSGSAMKAQGQFSTFVRSPFTTAGTWMKGFGNYASGKDAKDAFKAASSDSGKSSGGGGGGSTPLPGSKRQK